MSFNVIHNINFAAESVLNSTFSLNGLASTYPDVINHGCWCAKINSANDKSILGGPVPQDDLDEICKQWFQCRHCNDHIRGGSCYNIENVNLISYDMNADVSNKNLECVVSSDDCSNDSCAIDQYYSNLIIDYMDSEVFSLIQVSDRSVCHPSGGPRGSVANNNNSGAGGHFAQGSDQIQICQGTAPYLEVVKRNSINNACLSNEYYLGEEFGCSSDLRLEDTTKSRQGWKDYFTQVTTLGVSALGGNQLDNKIQSIGETVFHNQEQLREIRLYENNIRELPANLISKNINLQSIALSGNPIISIDADFFSKNPELLLIDLARTELTTLPTGLFDQNPKLERLNFSDNKLKTLGVTLFSNLPNLRNLALANNDLTEINAGMLGVNPYSWPYRYGEALTVVHMVGNPCRYSNCERTTTGKNQLMTKGYPNCRCDPL